MKALRLVGSYVAVLLVGIAIGLVWIAEASAATSTVTTSSGYRVTISGPASATVGAPVAYTATCGGAPCSFGEFRAFGGPINRLGEGFGRGPLGSYSFRAPGLYSMRYRVGMTCGRQACPVDVFLTTSVAARGAPGLVS